MSGRNLSLVLTILLGAALSGCLAPGELQGPPAAATGPPDTGNATTPPPTADPAGTVRVVALTPELARVADATATVGARTATTGTDGIATIAGLAPGVYDVRVEKEGWRAARTGVEVQAGRTVDVQAKLLPGDEALPEPPGNTTFTQEYDYAGVFQCSLTYLIITGDCLLAADFLLNETLGLPARPGDNTEDQNAFSFPLDTGWESVVVEMSWDAPLAPMGEKMQLALEPSEYPEEGHAPKYARVTGGSPLAFAVHNGVAHPTASVSADGDEPDMPNARGGEVVTARAYVLGELHNPGGTNFLGVGAAYGQRFDIYITVFYGEPAPDGYTRIPT